MDMLFCAKWYSCCKVVRCCCCSEMIYQLLNMLMRHTAMKDHVRKLTHRKRNSTHIQRLKSLPPDTAEHFREHLSLMRCDVAMWPSGLETGQRVCTHGKQRPDFSCGTSESLKAEQTSPSTRLDASRTCIGKNFRRTGF